MGAETDFSRLPRSPETEILNHEHRNWKADMMSALGESVSFGRFLSEPLEWGKWSAFAHNRYLEEAARQSRPGSVAQKKAFFEAHYAKKRKSEADADDGDEGKAEGMGARTGEGKGSSGGEGNREGLDGTEGIRMRMRKRRRDARDEGFAGKQNPRKIGGTRRQAARNRTGE